MATKMRQKNMAFMDFGANAARLAIFAITPGAPPMLMLEKRIVTRLGAGVKHGKLDKSAMRRALSAARRLTAPARARHAQITAVATAAVRDSVSRADFCARFYAVTGAPLQVINGDREARLIYQALAPTLPADEPTLMLDIGGGSAELIIGNAGRIFEAVSLPLGAVRLTEKIPALRNAGPVSSAVLRQTRAYVLKLTGARLYALRRHGATAAIGVAGAAGAIGAMARCRCQSAAAGHGEMVVRGNFPMELAEQLRRLSPAQRSRVPGMTPDRADIILAGLTIMTVILQALRIKRLLISPRSLCDGLLMENIRHLHGAGAPAPPDGCGGL